MVSSVGIADPPPQLISAPRICGRRWGEMQREVSCIIRYRILFVLASRCEMDLNYTSEHEFTWINEDDERNEDLEIVYSIEKINDNDDQSLIH